MISLLEDKKIRVLNLNIKLKIRWFLLVLLSALIFGAIGYGYGSYITSVQCNAYYGSQIEPECNSNFLDAETMTWGNSTIEDDIISSDISKDIIEGIGGQNG